MDQITIVEAKPREERGKNARAACADRERFLPCCMAAKAKRHDCRSNTKQLGVILRSASRPQHDLPGEVCRGEHDAIVKDWQVDPVTGCCCMWICCAWPWTCACTSKFRAHLRRSAGREAAGRHLRNGYARSGNRVLAVGNPERIPRRRQRPDAEAGNCVRADLPMDTTKIKLLTDPQRVLAHVVALRVEEEKPAEAVAADARAGRARSHQEGQEGRRRRRGRRGQARKNRKEEELCPPAAWAARV